jgi:hypothetical protein
MKVCLLLGGGPPEQLEKSCGPRAIEDRERRRQQLDASTFGGEAVRRPRRLAHAAWSDSTLSPEWQKDANHPGASGDSALRRDQPQPSDDRSWQQASHCPARSWRVSDRVIDTLTKGFGIRLIRTDPPESVDCGRCRALVKSQSGGSGRRLAQKPFSGFGEPSGCDGDALGLKHDLPPIANGHRATKPP